MNFLKGLWLGIVKALSAFFDTVILKPFKAVFGDEHGGFIKTKYFDRGIVVLVVVGYLIFWGLSKFMDKETLNIKKNIDKERTIRDSEKSTLVDDVLKRKDKRAYGNDQPKMFNGEYQQALMNLKNNQNKELQATKEACEEVYQKVSSGKKLNENEQKLFDKCQDKNVLNLTQDQLKALEVLNDPNATQAEKDLANKIFKDEATEADRKLFEALTGDDELKKRAAKALINNEPMTDEQRALLEKIIDGTATAEDIEKAKALLDEIDAKKEARKREKLSASERADLINGEIAALELENKKLEEDLARDKARYDSIMDKIANDPNYVPTPEELAFLEEYNRKRDKLLTNKKRIKELKDELAKINSELLSRLKKSEKKFNESIGNAVVRKVKKEEKKDTNKSPKKKPSKKKPKKNKTPKKKKHYALSKEEKELLEALGESEDAQVIELTIVDPLASGIIEPGGEQKVLVEDTSDDNGIILSPSLKIRAVLEDRIFITDSAQATSYNIRILEDVKDISARTKVFNRGSIAVLTISGFDPNTQLAQGTIGVVINGKEIVDTQIAVEIPGAVKKNTGLQLTALAIGEWLRGVGQYFANQGQARFNDDTLLTDVIGQASGETASTMTDRLSEVIVGDLQSAKAVFFAPRSMRLILRPQVRKVELERD